MITGEKGSNKKKALFSIFVKFLLVSIISTVIPVIITGILIVFSYQEVISQFLTEQETELVKETGQGLFLTLYNIRIQIGLTLFIVIVLTLFSNVLMTRNLVRPLRNLIKGTKEVAKGNLDYVIKVETKDELGELTERFNEMTQGLKKARLSSEEVKATLEIKVNARTKELKELAVSLEDQIKERTRELQERITELEKFHRLTVGRELKMVELKRGIEKLESELEKANKEKKEIYLIKSKIKHG